MVKIGNVELGLRPVIAGVMRELSIQDAVRAKSSGADVIELRLDLLKSEDRRVERVNEFLGLLKMPVIITNRRREEGGSFAGTEEEQIALLSSILETRQVNAVDIEFLSHEVIKRRLIEQANKLQIPVILSLHDLKGMPDHEKILKTIDDMYDEGGSIAKIAVTPKTLNDALFLLTLTHAVSKAGKSLVCIGMGSGPIGRHLRLITPVYGSVLTYGFIGSEESSVAPGQFGVKELRYTLDMLGLGAARRRNNGAGAI